MDRPTFSVCQWEINRIPPPGLPARLARDFIIEPKHLVLKKGVTSFGRALPNTIRCTESVLTSRRHCSIILKDDGSLFILDHKSLNGTFLHSEKVLPERETSLSDGDVVGLGVDPSMDSLDPDHTPNSQYIFKITRKILPKDELAAHDQSTVVPIQAGVSYSYNNPSHSNIDKPSTSSCGTLFQKNEDKTLNINSPKDVKPLQNTLKKNECEVVELVDSSDDEGDVIKSVDEKITSNQTINILDNKLNPTPNNIITIDGDIDTPTLDKPITIPNNELNPTPNKIIIIDGDTDIPTSDKPITILDNKLNPTPNNIITIDGDIDIPTSDKPITIPNNELNPTPNKIIIIDGDTDIPTSDKPITIPNNELNPTPNNIITIDGDIDIPTSDKPITIPNNELNPTHNKKIIIDGDTDIPTLDKPITIRDNKLNPTPNNIITIDSDADVPKLEFVDKECLKQEDNASKTNDNNVETTANCDISDEVLLNIKEVESAYHMNMADGISEMKNKNENVIESHRDISRPGNYNISLSSGSSVKSEKIKTKKDKLVNTNVGDGVPEEVYLSDDVQSDSEDQHVRKTGQNKESNEETRPLEIKQEETHQMGSYTVDDDDIILIEDDDGELPCSQLFDISCVEDTTDAGNVEEPTVDNEKNVDTEYWQVVDEPNDSDSDSDAEQWFQRLSQTHEPDSEEDEDEEDKKEEEENIDKSYADNYNNDEPLCKNLSEKLVHPGNNETLNQTGSTSYQSLVEPVIDNCQLSEPIFRKIPSGSKRKLSVSSEEDLEETHEQVSRTTEFCKRNDNEIYEVGEPSVSSCNKNFSHSLQHSTKDSKVKEIHKKSLTRRKSGESTDSSSSSTKSKKQKKSDKLEKISSSATHTLPTHKRHAPHTKSEESDESSCSSTTKKRYKKDDNLKENSSHLLSNSNTDGISSVSNKYEKHLSRKYKHKRKHSTDTNSSTDTYSHDRETSKDEVHSTADIKESSDESELEWVNVTKQICGAFITVHGKKPHKPLPEDQSVNNEIQDENTFDDIEDKIKPSKIVKSFKQQVSSNSNEFSDIQIEKQLNKCVIIDKTNKYKESTASIDEQLQDTSATKTSVRADNSKESATSVAQNILDKEYPVATDKKLTVVSKKINASNKKKGIPIIEAKSIKTSRKSVTHESETFNKKDIQTHENKNEQWLSNNKASKHVQQSISKADARAYRKERLKDLALKDALENKQHDKPKMFVPKNKTKTTTKSRNDMFLQDLVSSDSTVVEKSDKLQKDAPLASYKIPRRPSSTEDHVQTTEATTSSLKESKQGVEAKPLISPQQASIAKPSLKPVSDKSKQPNSLSTSDTNNQSMIDQILKSAQMKPMNNTLKISKPQVKASVGGVENEEPIKIVYLKEEEYHRMFQGNNCHPSVKQKSIIKQSPTPKDKKKRLKFNLPNDDKNIVYVSIRKFEVEEDSKLKPVTRSASKEYMKGKKPSLRKSEDPKYTNYWEETIYTICTWNCTWFEEEDKFKKERNCIPKDPPVFDGQMYHLTGEFSDHKDYRRGIFPLMLYELWGNISKQYDLAHMKQNNRTHPIFNIEIRGSTDRIISNVFFTKVKKPALIFVRCQALLDKKQQDVWPRVGDLVVLSLIFKDTMRETRDGKQQVIKGGERRIFGYVSDCPPPKPINFHPDVSPRLRQQCPNANMVMEGLNIVIKGNRAQHIDIKEGARFIVLKNIKPDLRAFEAVDRLPTSPLCRQICQPRGNLGSLRHVTADQMSQPLVNHLNPSQKKAVMSIAKECIEDTTMIHLVHGPPGCGKSEVIINIILQMWFDWFSTYRTTGGFRQILLCAPSNSAIDDIVNKLVNRRDALLNVKGIPKFELIRVGLPQSTHESCSHLTLDYLTKMELKRLKEVKEDENQKRIEIQCLQAKKHQLSQKLDSLNNRRRNMNPAYNDKREANMLKEINDVEKKLAETIARISYFESGKQPDGKEMASKYKETQLELLQKANIVATTLSSCYNGIMSEAYYKGFIRFDCCIVDEATQCIEPDTLIPLMLGVRKLVLVGDPKQLPAIVVTSTAKAHGLEKSLFARHYDWWKKHQRDMNVPDNPCHFLNIQYRMHPEIAQWPSEHFYENRLLSLESLRDRSVSCALVPYVVLSHSHQQNTQEGECNTEEGRIVANLVRGITSHPLCQGMSIGVITPYNRQKDDLKRRINLREFPNLEVGTVDSYQGRERDVVIFSCVRTEGVGFLGGPERLNVALTRAKHSLIVVGNFLSLQVLSKRDQTWNSLLINARNRNLFKPIVNNHTVCSLVFKPGLGGGIV